ncbi:hypothetical protein BDP27DRAFT_1367446 [Rhodocollybia butyracea]|uniref:Uncharacterized protein n=1 Tax=Rhodocollybia butyracea TaxID=206335 RepID=A0A9P5U3W2_9AGAR|nr:hypothetical protein BDP27DRAFT_1367446 [Rhodocollybia butyracea]
MTLSARTNSISTATPNVTQAASTSDSSGLLPGILSKLFSMSNSTASSQDSGTATITSTSVSTSTIPSQSSLVPSESSTSFAIPTENSLAIASGASSVTTSENSLSSSLATTSGSQSLVIASRSQTTSSPGQTTTTGSPVPSGSGTHPNVSTSPPKHSISAGVIAGAVIGSLFALVAVIAILMIYRRRRRGAPDQTSPSKQGTTREYELNALDVNIGVRSRTSLLPEKAEARTSIFTSENPENPESNFRSTLSGSPLLPLRFIQNTDNNDDVRVQMGRMEANIGRMAEHIHRLESQLDGTVDGHSDAPPPTYVSS